ncbi:tripartite tricarboxylate transporter substrate binding protein [Cupriavidus sp. CV2]|uniref:Bug family tripartite tricarboxylate transporter substrate binding protein n=1 Tax=Cupriavidus ulmosensis TaxID=3065913 RepID=UPI00296AF4DC|nr:tripartite tricarboxylate transporter substrate binding protein [Cupriavidus sp. CV2]MDW3682780.1 tripartite tricarboxylate transporter substrate binding protein [Cupriavidus sp. CV2]
MMKSRRRFCLALGSAALGSVAVPSVARSEAFPSRTITVIVPFAPGGTSDLVARILAESAGAQMGQSIIIDNRSGGDGIIGAQLVARANPDGYTLLQASTGHVILPSLRSDLRYDWQRSLVPVFGTTMVPQAIAVSAKSQIRSMPDLAAAAKAAPQGIDYASGGTGSISHLTAAFLIHALKVRATHVAYRGLNNAVVALLSGQVLFTVVNIPDVAEFVKAGTLRLIAVTSKQRLPQLPDVPTMVEQGFSGWTSSAWSAYLAPAKTPPEIVDRIYRAYSAAANDPRVKERLGTIGVSLHPMNGTELGTFMRKESTRWRGIIEENQIKLES